MTPGSPHREASFEQERLWRLDSATDAPVTTNAWRMRLRGPLDIGALRGALSAAVRWHDALRTTLQIVDGGLVAVVADPRPADLPLIDLAARVPAGGVESAAAEESRADAARMVDITTEPWRARLLRLAAEEHLLLFTAHAAVLDRASFPLLAAELAATSAGAAPATLHHARTSVEQGRGGGCPADRLGANRRAAPQDVPLLDLPTDRPHPAKRTHGGDVAVRPLPASLLRGLSALAAAAEVDLSDVLRAGFALLLHRYTGQPLLAFGTTASLRGDEQVGAIGPFNAPAVVTSRLDETATFGTLVKRIRAAAIPSAQLGDPTLTAGSPLMDTFIAVEPSCYTIEVAGATVVESTFTHTGAVGSDLDVRVEAGPDARLVAAYRGDLFDRTTVDRMLGHLEHLLSAALEYTDRPATRLMMMTQGELRQVLVEWNDTAAPFPADATIHAVFEQQARRIPDAVAVECGTERLTYRGLNEWANQFAHSLGALGVRRGGLVALCLERSVDLVIAMLGVLKSGGAYVALDPAYPAERLAGMLSDTAAPLLVTQERLLAILPKTSVPTVVLDRDRAALAAQPSADPAAGASGADLASVVFTSGSTGRSKGVDTPHRGILRLVVNTDILTLDERTTFLQIDPLSFDPALEIFGPLLNGGRVVLLPPGTPTPAAIARAIQEHDVNTVWLVAPLFHLLVDHHLDELRGLRQLMAGGDVLSVPRVRRVVERLGECAMVNGYGPTEVSAFSISYRVRDVPADCSSIPIGRPIRNTTAYVLDDRMEPVPVGVWGELYLGGPGVALGYHDRPELTAERFVENPFDADAGHLYRTGDRVRWLPSGDLQFHGRLDEQVKIDGLRVELGEVRSALLAAPKVRDAVVTAPEIGGRRTLLAHIVPAGTGSVDVQAVRDHVSRVLPSVMVPAHVVLVDALPLTPNGKVDTKALPVPGPAAGTASRPPSDLTERRIAEIWRGILSVDALGAGDDFFALGGHSLRAVPLVTEVGRAFGVDVTVQDLFENRTVEALARRVEVLMLAALGDADLVALLAGIEVRTERP